MTPAEKRLLMFLAETVLYNSELLSRLDSNKLIDLMDNAETPLERAERMKER